MNAASTRAVASTVILECNDRVEFDAPPPSSRHRTCMNLEELLEVRVFRQFNIRSVEILALHWDNRKLTRHCILFKRT